MGGRGEGSVCVCVCVCVRGGGRGVLRFIRRTLYLTGDVSVDKGETNERWVTLVTSVHACRATLTMGTPFTGARALALINHAADP